MGTPNVWLRLRTLAPWVSPLVTGSSLRALVTRNRWLLARLAARATGLAPLASFRWFRAGCSRSFLERACHADRLALGSSGSSRHWSRSALVFAACACCTPQSPGGSSAGLARSPLPLTSSVPPLGPRAREFHWNSAALVSFTLVAV
ncbi:MAG: hypothetical protein ACK559_33050 [bacterium]